MFEALVKKLESLEELVSMTGDPEIVAMSKFLCDRIMHPDSYVVMLGETSSGKSSVINGLLGASVLPMKANPTTAAITEVELSNRVSSDEYYAINKNAAIEKIDEELFLQLSELPDDKLKRLKVIKKSVNPAINNLRIFDTPGYGSIVKEHEEVLKDFLPNSDVIIYTVNYKIGVQQDDYIFLSFLRELIREEVKIYLLVNRCPQGVDVNNAKIRNITNVVSDVLTIDPEVFVIPNIAEDDGTGHPLPYCGELWDSVVAALSSPERLKSLENAFECYIGDLYRQCYKVIESRYLSAKFDADAYEELKRIQKDSAERISNAIPTLIYPTFDRIEKNLPNKFQEVRDSVHEHVVGKIGSSNKTEQEEMVAYVNSHLLPYTIKVETDNVIQHYIDVELDDLNDKVDDYLQKELIRFNNEISIQIKTNLDVATTSLLSGVAKEVGKNSLQRYFTTFGGMGRANAGIANAASHLLKKIGGTFGKTFSRATHNGLKHFLKKIGATSMKTIGVAIAVITELLFVVLDLVSWKWKLRNKVGDALDEWQIQTCVDVIIDLRKLKEVNVETIRNIADDILCTFEEEKSDDIEECRQQYEYAKSIGEKLNIE